ncbi:MAG: NPCBM/NEW2 domain-containing protein [Pirellulales bacterium]|nr:NPCBM/NEW2 domain-containing protein [Pirellulales bacterium]
MKTNLAYCIAITLLLFKPASANAAPPTPDEMAEARRWAAAKFEGVENNSEVNAGLQVLANLNAVQLNLRINKPLQIVDKQYTRGLYCHAFSKVVVRLPGPARTFKAVVGVDSNDQTRPGRGSVVFSVDVGGKNLFKSDVMREGMPGKAVSVDLGGARQFVLEVNDAGDGIPCDQADWADAKVTLADGSDVWLGDLPLCDNRKRDYSAEPFFSFNYDGKPSSQFLSSWQLKREVRQLDTHRTQHTLTYSDPKTGLVVRCVGIAWKDYPTVEWTLYLKNTGHADTPLIESLQAIDTSFEREATGEFVLHHQTGDRCTLDSFTPLRTVLGPNVSKRFAPVGGRPSDTEWPYYNLENPQAKEGILMAIGWPGQWATKFDRDAGTSLRVMGGQELTHFLLHPGEEVRTPLIVLQFYKGDRMRAQNVWRRWMFDHNFPKDHGKPLAPKTGAATIGFYNAMNTQAGDLEFINRSLDNGLELTTWWMDAGWYKCAPVGWPKTGTWEVDEKRFPGGIKAISDHCHARGLELLVWFEVERVHPDTWLTKYHPEWIHGGAGGGLFKMDDPAARRWITDHVDKLLVSQGIDFYRSDFNIAPLRYWRANDAPDRQGITEIRYIEGYLAYWDELRRRHPGMLIDSCSSGGRRNDMETMRRAVPLLRSDYEGRSDGTQCQTLAYAIWLPYFDGVHNWNDSPYVFRSSIAPFLQRNWDVRRKDFPFEQARKFLKEWRSVADYWFGDFYPLTEHSTADNVWIAWQFHREDKNAGLIQAFRRPNCSYVSAQYQLRSLEPDAKYAVSNLDTEQSREITGRDLMENGLLITIPQKPGAVLVTYRKVEQ